MRKLTTPPRRHYSFQGNDISVCNNVCVQSIIDQLGEKLNVGKQSVQGNVMSHPFQISDNQLPYSGRPKSRSRSMFISRLDHVITNSLLTEKLISSQRPQPPDEGSISLFPGECSSHPFSQTPTSPGWQTPESPKKIFGSLSPSSTGSSNRSRWKASRWMSNNDLPPAFRASLDNSLSPRKGEKVKVGASLSQVQNMANPSATKKNFKHKRHPSKLQRTWPPVLKRMGRPSQSQLLESSLSDLRLMACVKSQRCSFESPLVPPLHDEGNFQQERSLSPTRKMQAQEEEVRKETIYDTNNTVDPQGRPSQAPQAISGLASGIKSGKCKASLRIRWSGPEVFFIEGRQRKYFQPLYYDDLLEDRFQPGSDHSATKPLLVDRFGARVKDCSPDIPNRPRRDDDWSDYESEGDDNENDSVQEQKDDVGQIEDDSVPGRSPSIWITVLDNDCDEASELLWRVKRVWADPTLDCREKERIIPDEDLLNTLKNLSGLPAIPTVSPLEVDPGDATKANADSLSNWSIKKFYDIDGEIVDEVAGFAEKAYDENTMLDVIVALAKESRSTVVVPSWSVRLFDDPIQHFPQLDAGEICLPVVKPAMELRWHANPQSAPCTAFEDSMSVLETEDCVSLTDSTRKSTTTSDACDQNVPCTKGGYLNSSLSSSLALDAIVHADARAVESSLGCVVNSSEVEMNFIKIRENVFETQLKRKKKRKDHGTLADLLSPPPITTFYGIS